ncbi:MAG: hypothetical protein KJO22_01390 [Bacteroidia bacterium]|nr:hypothetical protein [Bacteroidia bacterium]
MKKLLFSMSVLLIILSCNEIHKNDKKVKEGNHENLVETIHFHRTSQENKGVLVLNSGPKGGNYTNSFGDEIRYTIFRVQVINDTIIPIELDFALPKNPIALLPDSKVILDIFLLPDSLTPKGLQDNLNFGITGIDTFFESKVKNTSVVKTFIQPNEHYIFYIGILFKSEITNGTTRSKLFINGQNIDAPFLPFTKIESDLKENNILELVYGIGVDPQTIINYYRVDL